MTDSSIQQDTEYLDHCYFCHESKLKIRESQQRKNPIYCGAVDYYGELEWERDRHTFAVTPKIRAALEADEKAEKEYFAELAKELSS